MRSRWTTLPLLFLGLGTACVAFFQARMLPTIVAGVVALYTLELYALIATSVGEVPIPRPTTILRSLNDAISKIVSGSKQSPRKE